MRRSLFIPGIVVGAAAVWVGPALASPRVDGPPAPWQVTRLGEVDIPTGTMFHDTEIGGLSGIDYDRREHDYVAISDDRGGNGAPRFYRLTIDLSDGMLRRDDVVFTDVTPLRDRRGQPVATGSVDPESIRSGPFPGLLYWTSEGDADAGVPPSVRVMDREGRAQGRFVIPPVFRPGRSHGVRNNLAFESLTYDARDRDWITATENALIQDGPEAGQQTASPARVLVLDGDTGRPRAQYAYRVSPIPDAPRGLMGSANNGLSELLWLDHDRYLALERAYASGVGNRIRLFLTTTRGATDVTGWDTLRGRAYRPMSKRLLLDIGRTGVSPDNIEGMTFGPRIHGDRTLILVADNNFSTAQTTQIIAYRLHATRPASSGHRHGPPHDARGRR